MAVRPVLLLSVAGSSSAAFFVVVSCVGLFTSALVLTDVRDGVGDEHVEGELFHGHLRAGDDVQDVELVGLGRLEALFFLFDVFLHCFVLEPVRGEFGAEVRVGLWITENGVDST